MSPCETVKSPDQPVADLMAPCDNSFVNVPDDVRRLVALIEAERLIEERKESPAWQAINRWEQQAAEMPQQPCPVDHVLTPGLYTRIIFMPAGSRVSSKIHLFEHPFTIAAGVVSVWDGENGWHTLRAPHVGVTKPATRRILYVHENCIWITHHVTNETDVNKILGAIHYDHMKLGHMDSVSPERMAEMRLNQKGELR